MAVDIVLDDITVFVPGVDPGQAGALITGALARAAVLAPCIQDLEFPYEDAAKAIIVEAILRRIETGAGALSLQQAGPFQQAIDTRTSPRELYWPGEVLELQRLCAEASTDTTDNAGALPEGYFPPPPASWPDPAVVVVASPFPTGNL